MPEPLPLPIRVLVKGASTVGWMSPMSGPRSDLAFPRAMQAALVAAGHPTEMQTITIPSERTKTTLATWQAEIIGYSPDVIVLVYGHYETIHLFLPWWLERHAHSLKTRPRPVPELYRKLLLQPFWMFLARMQARADHRWPLVRRKRPERVAADLERLIGHIQTMHSPLVFVFELLDPTMRYQSWFPGMTARMSVMNNTLAQMVDRIDLPNVRYFKIRDMITDYVDGDMEAATPDGFHFSPDVHRLIGNELARQTLDWADTQEHLKLP
jgi:hypothetical protein